MGSLETDTLESWKAEHSPNIWKYDPDDGKPITWEFDSWIEGRKYDVMTGLITFPGCLKVRASGRGPAPERAGDWQNTYTYEAYNFRTVKGKVIVKR